MNKYKTLLLLTIILICLSLCISLFLEEKGLENYFMAIPKHSNVVGVNVDKIEDLNEENFLISYEIKKEESIKALNSKHDVLLIGTNYVYPYITGYAFAEGSFFTQSSQEQKIRTVVLNELAAYELFGNYDIAGNNIILQGKFYTVTGVIKDEDSENKNVYVPITLLNSRPTAFITYIDLENGITEEYIKNELKELDITESNYYFLNFEKISKTIHEQTLILFLAIILVVFSIILKYSIRNFKILYEAFKGLLTQNYFQEILIKKPRFIYKMFRSLLCIVFCIFGLLIIAYNIFKIYINWNVDLEELIEINLDYFVSQIQVIQHVFIFSTIAFVSFIIVLIIFIVLMLKKLPLEIEG